DERDPLACLQPRQQLSCPRRLVVLVVGEQACADPAALEEPTGAARVLAEHQVGLGELVQHTQGDVVQVADRGRADREHGAGYATSGCGPRAAPITPAAVPSSARTILPSSRTGGRASRRMISSAGSSRKSPADAKPPPITTICGRKTFTKLPIAAPSFR